MPIIHTLNKGSLDHPAAQDCLRSLDKLDALVLIEDGVYLTQRIKITKTSIRLCALQHDLHLRGLSPLQSHIQIINDVEFVDMCAQYDKIINWY